MYMFAVYHRIWCGVLSSVRINCELNVDVNQGEGLSVHFYLQKLSTDVKISLTVNAFGPHIA